jgi:bifunctional non-homologous end joining protein LigD
VRLLDRKQELRRLLGQSPDSLLKYMDHVDGQGMALFQRVCELDLEGIVAKQKFGPYVTDGSIDNRHELSPATESARA